MANSNRGNSSAKAPSNEQTTSRLQPKRAKPKFPLWLHPTGQWAKIIRKKFYYFGKDKDKALAEYLRVKNDLEAGRRPQPADAEHLTLQHLANVFLTHKKNQTQSGEISQRTFQDYYDVCDRLLKHFGKTVAVDQLRPDDLLTYRHVHGAGKSPHTIGNEVQRVRVVLRFAFEQGLIDRPVRFGEYKRPSKAAFRRQRATKGSRLFTSAELRVIIEAADFQLNAMILLGTNCGFGNSDIGQLPLEAIDLANGWITFARSKTGVERRCPLWPETIRALQDVITTRKSPKDEQFRHVLFVTKYGQPWHVDGKPRSAVSAEFRKLLLRLKIYRPGLSFYSLRHTFQTVADELGDYLATRRIMGHADNTISDHYREKFPDERLVRIVNHVRSRLFGGVNDAK